MSYQIGQFRRPQLDSYMTTLNVELDQAITSDATSEVINFYNICGNLTGDNILNNQNCYYLKFGIQQRSDSEQVFYLKLRNTEEVQDNEQFIEEYKVGRGTGVVYFEVILAPNSTYNQILWELQRTALDYRIINADGSYGRIANIVINNYSRLVDIITVLKSTYSNLEYFTKIGIQGPPSLLMCINRQQIRLGKSGIYELNNEINITSISFIPKDNINGLDYFIMDFEY